MVLWLTSVDSLEVVLICILEMFLEMFSVLISVPSSFDPSLRASVYYLKIVSCKKH